MAYALYAIKNTVSGKEYVGYTRNSAETRFETHLNNAKWKRVGALYDAMRKYGAEVFELKTLLVCGTHTEACGFERAIIEKFDTLIPNGYNMTLGGDGVPLTPERYAEINANKRGKRSEKQILASRRRIGRKSSPETVAKLSAARKGKKPSPEAIEKRRLGVLAYHAKRREVEGLPPKVICEKKPKGSCGWSPERREAERLRAIEQWDNAEARFAAGLRLKKQWECPDYRRNFSEKKKAYFEAKRKAI